MLSSRLYPLSIICAGLAAAIWTAPVAAAINTNSEAEREMMRSAQLWQNRFRTDLARQHVQKLLLIEPQSAWGLATLASIALQENKAAEAKQLIQKLQHQKADPQVIAQLQALMKLYEPQAQQELAQMRLLAQSGRTADAAALARKLFPNGPLALGSFNLEYYRTLAVGSGADAQLDAALRTQYEQTRDVQYQYLWVQRQLERGSPSSSLLGQIEALAMDAPPGDNTAQNLWRWALDKMPWESVAPALHRFLQRYPQDEAAKSMLAEAEQRTADAQRAALSPLNVAKRKANQALDSNQLEQAQEQAQKILALNANDPEGWGMLGYAAARQARFDQAQKAFEQAYRLSRAPHWKRLATTAHINGLLQPVDAAIARQDAAAVRETAQQILAIDPQHAQGLLLQAQALQLEEQYQLAQTAYAHVLEQHPQYMPAVSQLVRMLIAQQQWSAAQQALEAHAPSSADTQLEVTSLRAEILQGQAEQYLAQGLPESALQLLERALPLSPRNPWLRYRLARTYLQTAAPVSANAVMDAGVELVPEDVEMRYARALVRSAQAQWGPAAADLAHIPVAQRSAGMQQLLYESQLHALIQRALDAKNTENRDALLNQALALSAQPQDVETQAQLASIWAAQGLTAQALELWSQIAQHHVLTPAMQLAYAKVLQASPQEPAALAPLLQALVQNSHHLTPEQQLDLQDIYANRAGRRITALMEQGKVSAARDLAQHTLLPKVSSAADQAARGRLLAQAQDWDAALPLLQAALAQQPADFMLQLDTANAYARTGQLPQARTLAQQAQTVAAAQAPWQQLALVRLWQRMQEPQRAKDVLLQVQQHPDADRNEVLLHQARIAVDERQYAQASDYFGTVVDSPALLNEPLEKQASVRGEYQAVEARKQSWVEAAAQRIEKDGTPGISAIKGWELPMVAWRPRQDLQGHYFLHVDRIQLDAGTLDPIPAAGTGGSAQYGQLAAFIAAGHNASQLQGPLHSRASGFNVGTGFQGDRYQWDLGLIGLNMPVTNVVGGLSWDAAVTANSQWRMSLGRRPITGSLLSYAGAKDPATGKTWGGVVHNFVALRLSNRQAVWDKSANLSVGVITGKNVASNTRTQLRFSTGRDVWRSDKQRVYAGAALQWQAHSKDLSEYSWGHGGYYSPTSSTTFSIPVEWTGRAQAWTWRVQASVSLSNTSGSRSDLYPRSTNFPHAIPAAQQRGFYRSSGGSGTGWAFKAAIERQLNRNLAVGAQLGLDRSEDYAPNQLQVYVRYALDPVRRPLENQPRLVTPYSEF